MPHVDAGPGSSPRTRPIPNDSPFALHKDAGYRNQGGSRDLPSGPSRGVSVADPPSSELSRVRSPSP